MNSFLKKREEMGNLRVLKNHSSLIDFASNDYLGLSSSNTISSFSGSTGSRLLTGNSLLAEQLEEEIATFHGYEGALLFNCGYMANIGLLSAIGKEKPTIIFDTHIHASIHDGIVLSKATSFPFRHNDVNHLESRLAKRGSSDCYVCVESLYSQDGSIAPLKEIFALTEKWGAKLIVDEAHATGVYGPQGKGILASLNIKPFAHIVTFGKALGAFGSAILGSVTLKKYLINFARSFIYTTALPSSTLLAIQQSYAKLPLLDKEREYLFSLVSSLNYSSSPIQPIKIRGNVKVKWAAKILAKKGFYVPPLLSPTVKRGEEILRVVLHSFNKKDELKALQEALWTIL